MGKTGKKEKPKPPPKIPSLNKISDAARKAITRGIEDDHPVCNLESLGLSQRLINLLENSKILTLEQLMNTKKGTLMGISNLGPKGLKAIFKALSKYDEFTEEF
jgi:DNA-directed RNA polymerase alpha subunit